MHDTSVSAHSSETPLITHLSSSPPFISLPLSNVRFFIPSPPTFSHHSRKWSEDLVEDKNSITSIYSLMKECLYHNTEYARSEDVHEENKREGYNSADEAIWTLKREINKNRKCLVNESTPIYHLEQQDKQARTVHTVKVVVFILLNVQNWCRNPFLCLEKAMLAFFGLEETNVNPILHFYITLHLCGSWFVQVHYTQH